MGKPKHTKKFKWYLKLKNKSRVVKIVNTATMEPTRMLPQTATEILRKKLRYITKFPPEYRQAAKAVREVNQNHVVLESIFNPKKNTNRDAYQIATLTLRHAQEINYFLTKFKIIEENSTLHLEKLKVLIAEMIWGKQHLKSNGLHIDAIKYYEESMREASLKMTSMFPGSFNNVLPTLPTYVRINSLAIAVEDALELLADEGWKLLPNTCKTYSEYLCMVKSLNSMQKYFIRDFHMPNLLVFPPGTLFYNHRGYLSGKLILQDKASCLASVLLNPEPGSTVLDLCAAPGLKTNHLANLMNNHGLLYAKDIHPERFAALSKLVAKTNVQCAYLSQGDCFDLESFPKADYILVDPTCTYSGIFSNTDINGQTERVEHSKTKISKILKYTLLNSPFAKRVVFTTCSIFPAEGEQVVDQVLRILKNSYNLVDLKKLLGNQWGNEEVIEYGQIDKYDCESKCLHTIPEYDQCQGYFIAMFERNFKVPLPRYKWMETLSTSTKRPKINVITNTETSNFYEDDDLPQVQM